MLGSCRESLLSGRMIESGSAVDILRDLGARWAVLKATSVFHGRYIGYRASAEEKTRHIVEAQQVASCTSPM